MKKEDLPENNEEYITIDVDNAQTSKNEPKHGKRTASHAVEKKKKNKKESKHSSKDNNDNIKIKGSSNNKESINNSHSSKVHTDNNVTKSNKVVVIRRVILIIIAVLLAIVAVLGGLFCRALYKTDGNVTQALLSVTSDILGTDEPVFVLLLGVSKDIDTDLTDTMILCGYNPKTQKAFMLSIPRDTYIGSNPEYAGGYDKINALYQTNVKKTVSAVESLTGVDIDNYVVVQNIAIPNIVSAVGSVEFEVPIDMNYDDPTQNLHIHLKKGLQLIDKDKAEQLLRFRHNNDGTSYPSSYGDNDYGRMRTQRDFIKAVVNNLATNGNTLILKNAASTVFGNVDTNMSLAKIMSYIPSALEYNVESLRTEVLSVNSAMMNELYFAIPNVSKNKTIVSELIAYLEMDEKDVKKYFDPSNIRGQVTVPPQVKKDENAVDTNTVVTDVTNNVSNNTVNNTVNNVVNDANEVSNNVVNANEVPKNESVPEVCEHMYTYTDTATCTEAGIKTYTCSKCGNSYTEASPVKQHHFVNGKCTDCGTPDPDYTPPPLVDPPVHEENTTTGGEGGEIVQPPTDEGNEINP